MAGTKLIVDGQENIPEDGAVLYVGNHSSYYDILCSYVATERGMGFFAKKEMEKIPCPIPLDAFYQLPVFRS